MYRTGWLKEFYGFKNRQAVYDKKARVISEGTSSFTGIFQTHSLAKDDYEQQYACNFSFERIVLG